MKVFVLIVYLKMFSLNAADSIAFHDFSSQEACIYAKQQIRDWSSKAVCVPK